MAYDGAKDTGVIALNTHDIHITGGLTKQNSPRSLDINVSTVLKCHFMLNSHLARHLLLRPAKLTLALSEASLSRDTKTLFYL